MSKRFNREGGFTLIEVLVYTAMVAVLALFLSGSVVSLLRGRGLTGSQADVHDSIRFVEEKIVQDIRSATAIATPPTAGSNTSTLVLTVGGNTITYDVNANVLRRQVNAGTPAPLTPSSVSVTSTDFLRLENTNTQLSKTVVTIQSTLTFAASATSGEKAYTETRKFTATMP